MEIAVGERTVFFARRLPRRFRRAHGLGILVTAKVQGIDWSSPKVVGQRHPAGPGKFVQQRQLEQRPGAIGNLLYYKELRRFSGLHEAGGNGNLQ
jgi:hypothetical protein